MVDGTAIETLKPALRGQLITPDDSNYDEARHNLFNAMIDKKPALIARCANVADVMTSVNFARENGLAVAIRGGGHNVGGFAMVDDGLVIDLGEMNGIRVDPKTKTAWVEGGASWGDVDHATHAFGLATPSGVISTTGVAGLTLGGGIGYLTRGYGLTVDNLISADVVTADGKFVTASANENQDLFWALRGGGGNFGVVTSFEFRLHDISMAYAGPVFYPIEKTKEVLRFYREFIKTAPPELGAFFAFQIGPPAPFIPENLQGVPMCAIVCAYYGPKEKAEEVVRPIKEFGPPALVVMDFMPHPAVNSLFDGMLPYGQLHNYWKGDYINELTDEMIDIHAEYGPKVPGFQSTVHIYPVDGAPQKIGSSDTAYSFREANFVHVIAAMYPDAGETPQNRQWVRDYFDALHPLSAGGAYVNFLTDDDGEDRLKASFRDNYDRLVQIKRKYDPQNLFHVNQNIKP